MTVCWDTLRAARTRKSKNRCGLGNQQATRKGSPQRPYVIYLTGEAEGKEMVQTATSIFGR